MSIWKGLQFFVGKLPSYSCVGYKARKIKWHDLSPDYAGQTWVVTGASEGIGAAIARTAAMAGAKVVIVARSEDKMRALKDDVASRLARGEGLTPKAKGSGQIIIAPTDLSDLHAIERLSDHLGRKLVVDILINNVGILNTSHETTAEGFEKSYAVNLLGQYLLTERLMAMKSFNRGGLIVNMASGGLYNQPLNTRLINQDRDGFDGTMAYAAHKRAQISLTDHWRRLGAAHELFCYTMHPGWVRTSGVAQSLPGFNALLRPILRTPDEAADTALWLAKKRPATRENVLWFDRKQRSPYIFADTRTPEITQQELLDYLNADLRRARIGMPETA